MTVCNFAVRTLRIEVAQITKFESAQEVIDAGHGRENYLLDRWGSPCSKVNRRLAAERRAAPERREASVLNEMLGLIPELRVYKQAAASRTRVTRVHKTRLQPARAHSRSNHRTR